MARTITAGTLTELQKANVKLCHLVEMDFDTPTGTVYVCNVPGGVTYLGNDYLGAGHLLGISTVEETAGPQGSTASISISGVNSSNISLVLSEKFINRGLKIRLAFLVSDGSVATATQVVGNPITIFDGYMDSPVITERPGIDVVVTVAAYSKVGFQRKYGRHTSDEEQRAFYPNDTFFEFAGQLNTELIWGVEFHKGGK